MRSVSVTGVNTRMGAQVLVQSSTFVNTPIAITSRDSKEVGYVFGRNSCTSARN